jgi:hypothetical protein
MEDKLSDDKKTYSLQNKKYQEIKKRHQDL